MLQREKWWVGEVHGKPTRNEVSARGLGRAGIAEPDGEARGKTQAQRAPVGVQPANTHGSPETAYPPFPTPNATVREQRPCSVKGQDGPRANVRTGLPPTCQAI